MRWTVYGERPVYQSDWVGVSLVEVEPPGGERFEHHVVRVPGHATGTIVEDPDRGVLLLWRHRFITDTWGWEIPAGRVDRGELPEEAAAREVLEETGWQPGPLTFAFRFHPSNGLMDQVFHIFHAAGARYEGEPVDAFESERVEWVGLDDLRDIAASGQMRDGLSLTAVLHRLAFPPAATDSAAVVGGAAPGRR
jgi:8-oxo-dGTP pyrophosphatase MutT (NUDIX family)